jgi:DNA-binding MarR family transcriptional regulator
MVDRLKEKGLLLREHSTEDRRKVVVRISPEAVKDIEAVEAGLLELFEDLVKKLGPETTDQWCRVLATIQKVLLGEAKTIQNE